MTLKQLAKKMNIPTSTICRWSKADAWKDKRDKLRKRALQKATSRAVDKKSRELQKLMTASGSMEDALIHAAAQFATALEAAAADEKQREKIADGFRARNLQSLAGAIATAVTTRMTLCGMLSPVDKARLDIDRRRLAMEERREKRESDEDQNSKEIRITFDAPAESDITLEDLIK